MITLERGRQSLFLFVIFIFVLVQVSITDEVNTVHLDCSYHETKQVGKNPKYLNW